MDEREANIDLLFRNGLKDYEVLPPPEVWNTIQPAVRSNQKAAIILRAAAVITVFLALSFVAYQWSRDIQPGSDIPQLAFNIEAVSPFIVSPASTFLVEKTGKPPGALKYYEPAVSSIAEQSIVANTTVDAIPLVAELQKTNGISVVRSFSEKDPVLARRTSSVNKPFVIAAIEPVYIPQNATSNTERWSIGAMASPTYYSRFGSGSDVLSQQLDAADKPQISYSGGVAVTYKINKRFSIQTGLYYASLDQKVGGINSFGGFQKYDYTKGDHNFEVLTSSGSVYSSNPDVFLIADGPAQRILTAYTNDVFDPKKASLQYLNNTIIQNFSYLELPVVLKYKIIDKALDFSVIGGMSYDLLVNNSAYTRVNGDKYPVGKTEGLNVLTLSSSLGVGMEYNLSHKVSLNLEPTFRYYLNPFNEVTGSKNHPYSFGVFSGISYKF